MLGAVCGIHSFHRTALSTENKNKSYREREREREREKNARRLSSDGAVVLINKKTVF